MRLLLDVVLSLVVKASDLKTRSFAFGALLAQLLCLQSSAAQTEAASAPSAKAIPPSKSASEPKSPSASPGVAATVTVVGDRPTNRIDRQVYDVKSDTANSNDSVADTLNKVPSVAVDADGNVSVRGRNNVQVLIDGKPSAMMQNENRGVVLNSLPASDLESVEVINNPGAQFGNEGGGGPILNLVMRRERRPGGFAGVSANAGTGGRYNSSVFGSYNTGRFGAQGSAYTRHDGRNMAGDTVRTRIDPTVGTITRSTQNSASEGFNDSTGFNSTLNYNVGTRDILGAGIMYNKTRIDQQAEDRYLSFGSDERAYSDYVRSMSRLGRLENYSGTVRFDHKGLQPGETLKFDFRISGSNNNSSVDYANRFAIRPESLLDTRSRQLNLVNNRIADFTGDYEGTVGSGVLKLGFKASTNHSVFDTSYTNIDPITFAETVTPSRTNLFRYKDSNLALYSSYQLRLTNNLGVLGGLRAEYSDINMHQVTSNVLAKNSYLKYIPSLFFNYKASDRTNLRFSYAHRIRRPTPGELNPFIVYIDELNRTSGNPNLAPTQSDSFELGIETRIGMVDTNVRGYLRRDSGLISERRVFMDQNVLLTTRENAGSSRSEGLEFTLSGKLSPKLTINTSGNLGYTAQTITSGPLGESGTRTAKSLNGNARATYQMTNVDNLQVAVTAQGKSLFGQGYREPFYSAQFTYRRSITQALSLVFDIRDIFNSVKYESVTDTPLLKERSFRRTQGRLVFIGFSYRFSPSVAAPRRSSSGN